MIVQAPPAAPTPVQQPEIALDEAKSAVPGPAAPVESKHVAKPVAPKRAVAPDPAPVVVVEKPVAPAARSAAEATTATGDCTARVVTEPKDAKVIWAGTAIGRSPIDGARVPCGPATVTIERERWQAVTVDVNAQAGVAAKVHERLRRPRTALAVSTTPPGAQISVNHVAAGAAPKRIDVSRFEQVQIRATLKGYQPWNKTLYLKEGDAKLDIQLVARK